MKNGKKTAYEEIIHVASQSLNLSFKNFLQGEALICKWTDFCSKTLTLQRVSPELLLN